MGSIITIWFLGMMSWLQDPPRLLAFKQPISKGMKRMEITMQGEEVHRNSQSSTNYLFWLVTNDPTSTKIMSITVNGHSYTFDTVLVHGNLHVEDGIRWPTDAGRQLPDSIGTAIRIFIKDSIVAPRSQEERIVLRYKENGKCARKIRQNIKVLPAKLTE